MIILLLAGLGVGSTLVNIISSEKKEKVWYVAYFVLFLIILLKSIIWGTI